MAFIQAAFLGTSTTLRYVIISILQHPNEASKMRAELDRVVGRERCLTMDDKDNLPYLNAFLLETHRCNKVNSFSAQHTNEKHANAC